jgi:hypothetical protein
MVIEITVMTFIFEFVIIKVNVLINNAQFMREGGNIC